MSNEIKTPERSEYIFTQASEDTFKFKVRAPREAHIALLSKPSEFATPIYEIILGTSNNQKSIIRKNLQEILTTADTPDILHSGHFRSFWVSWKDQIIAVGRENADNGFMSYAMTDIFKIYFIGIRVGDDAHGTWILEAPPKFSGPGFWLPAKGGAVPEYGMSAGYDGEKLYIARAVHAGELLPGKLVPSKGVCFVSHGGAEYKYENYEVFCASGGHWVMASDHVPGNAVRGGKTQDGETLYLGRVEHEGASGTITSLGKVQLTHECCYIPYEGKELVFKAYEVFVWEPFGMRGMGFVRWQKSI